MKKKIAALIAAMAAVLILAGCGSHEILKEKENEENLISRFVMVETTGIWDVVYDRETKVLYAVSKGRGVFTLLVDQNGDPLLYDED